MPSHLKRRNGSVTLFRNSKYIPFYYFIPKCILSRCSAELNSIPRNPQKLLHDSTACDFVESNLFMLLIYDATAYMAWPHMGYSEYMEESYINVIECIISGRGIVNTPNGPKNCFEPAPIPFMKLLDNWDF